MARVPLLSGTRLVLATAPDDAVVLRPPPPAKAIADVGAAVRDACGSRSPATGSTLHARSGTRATIVVEPPALPIPGSPNDPRQHAISAVVDELERLGIPTGYQTFLVASGLARRLVAARARDARHARARAPLPRPRRSCTTSRIRSSSSLDDSSRPPLRVNRALVETDLVVVVSAAETVLHGGPAALLAAAGADALRAAGAYSLLETAASQGWHLAVALERALSRRVPLLGVSLVLNHPERRALCAAIRTTRTRSSGSRARRFATCTARCRRCFAATCCARCEPRSRSPPRSAARRRSRTRRRCCGRSSCAARSSTSRSTRS